VDGCFATYERIPLDVIALAKNELNRIEKLTFKANRGRQLNDGLLTHCT
jgi:hypothetical protein